VKPTNLEKTLEKTILARHPLIIKGIPGVGKTDIIEKVTNKLGYNLITLYGSTLEAPDLRGYPTYNFETDIARFVPFDDLKIIIETDEPTIVFFDDFGQSSQSVQSASMSLFLKRQIGNQKISDQVTFIIATNDKTHHAGVAGVLEPVKSRMLSIVKLDVNLEDWIKWALENSISAEVIAFMRLRGHELLSNFQPTTGLTNSPSPRAQESVSNIVKMEFPSDIEFELIKGAAGEGYATEMRGFLTLFSLTIRWFFMLIAAHWLPWQSLIEWKR